MLLILTSCTFAAAPSPDVAPAAPAVAATRPDAASATPTPGSVATPDQTTWPKDKATLETILPDASLGESTPLIDPIDEAAYGTSWTLTKAGVIAGVHCAKRLEITEMGWGCTLDQPLSLAKPQITLKAGAEVRFDYGVARPTFFVVSDVIPLVARVVVDGVPCTGEVSLAEGRFAGCELAADHAFGQLVLAAGSIVNHSVFGASGWYQILPKKEVYVPGGTVVPADTWFKLNANGSVEVFEEGMGD